MKTLYVPDDKVLIVRAFEDLCRNKGIKFSVAIIAMIESAISKQNPPQKRAGVQYPRLEAYLTSDRERMKKRSKELDEEWLRVKKSKGH